MNARVLMFVAVLAACIAGALGYAWHASTRLQSAAASAPMAASHKAEALPASGAFALFRSTAIDADYGHLAFEADGRRAVTPLSCDRVHYAAGRGICLQAARGAVTTYRALLFDRDLKVLHRWDLAGAPSRARMSADGRLAAATVFVQGHSYAAVAFSTRASIVDARTGTPVAEDLEKFEVRRDGQVVTGADFNFWGITFAPDGNRFYATLGTAGRQLLVEGDIAGRRLTVVHDDVECPSLSPDGTRVAFKRRQAIAGGGFRWGLHVLELDSRREIALSAETRNVDDQVEWLDEREIAYAMPEEAKGSTARTDVWALAADGSARPRLVLRSAFSPAMVRRATAAADERS